MGRRMPNGQRFKYVLNDGTAWTVPEAQDKMLELHGETASESLMQQRMKHSTDPEYVILKKKGEWTKDGGHVYSQINFARKKSKVNKVLSKPKLKPQPKLTAEEKAMQKALKSLGIAWT